MGCNLCRETERKFAGSCLSVLVLRRFDSNAEVCKCVCVCVCGCVGWNRYVVRLIYSNWIGFQRVGWREMGEINQSIISDRSGRVSSELSAGFFLVSGFFLLSFFLPFSPPSSSSTSRLVSQFWKDSSGMFFKISLVFLWDYRRHFSKDYWRSCRVSIGILSGGEKEDALFLPGFDQDSVCLSVFLSLFGGFFSLGFWLLP